MTFYVEKRLALGPISFGVSSRRDAESIDEHDALSTGASGEFLHRGGEGFFFGGHDRFARPALPSTPSVRTIPFSTSLKEARALLALIPLGFLFTLLGFAVIGRKGPQGWIEVILGLAMIATPIVLTANKRKQIREQEERERAEREATEKRNRELLAAYMAALERARDARNEEAFQQLEREREVLTLPYAIWGPTARRTTLLIGFDELARRGPAASKEVAQLMDRVSRAAGLSPEDQKGVKLDLYRTVVWHLIAADRLGESQSEQLQSIRKGFDIWDRDVPAESKAFDEFQRLRALTTQTLPRAQCTTPLGFQEYCIFQTPTDQAMLHVTNKRMILEGKKLFDVPIGRVFDVVVNSNDGVITVKTDKKLVRLRVEEPVYTAAILDLASQIDERPRGFA